MRRNSILWTASLAVLCAGIGAFWLIRASGNASGIAVNATGSAQSGAHDPLHRDSSLEAAPPSTARKDAIIQPVTTDPIVKETESSTINGTKESIGSSPDSDSKEGPSAKAVIDSLNPVSGGEAAFDSKFRNSTPEQRRQRRDALMAGLVSCNGDPEDKVDRERYAQLKDELAWLEQHP